MATWSREDKALVSELTQDLGTLVEGAPPILQTFLGRVRSALGVELGMAFGARLENGGAELDFASLSGFQAPERELREDLDGWFRASTGRFSLYDPVRPEPFQRNKPLWVGSYNDLSRTGRGPMIDASMLDLDDQEKTRTLANLRKAQAFCDRGDVGRHQQLRVLVCDGPSLLAWVGVLQEAPFTARQQRLFAALVPALQRRLKLEQRLVQSELHEMALLAALEALPRAAFLLNGKGAVLHANAIGRGRCEHDAALLDEELRASLAGSPSSAPFELTRLSQRGNEWFLAVERHRPRSVAPIVSHAALRYGLTRRQKDVLDALLRGLSNRRISRELECAERTVEVHVTAILEKTDSESRAELVARMWRELA